jgi:protein SCO1
MAEHRRRLIVAGAAAVLCAAVLAGCQRGDGVGATAAPKPSFKGIDITGAEYARELKLADADGRLRQLSDFHGKVTVVFFGFTQCPDVCPTTLVELAQVKKALGADGDKVQGVFVTVDPERDTAEVLKAYVGGFDAGFIALRGTPEETRAVAKDFKVFYAKVPGKTPTSYSVDHTAGSYIFDTQGRVRLFTRYGTGAEALTHDLKVLLAERQG